MSAIKNIRLLDYIKNDKTGKYFLVDCDKFINQEFNGLTRLEMYEKLVKIDVLNEYSVYAIGIDNYLKYVNNLLDGILYIGRFKIYRVSNFTQSLNEQMKIEQMRHIKEEKR